jgi:hemerythrin-like domain-containing protein
MRQPAAQSRPAGRTRRRGSVGHSTGRLDARARSTQARLADLSRRYPPPAGDQAPVQALNAGAGIIRRFIEDYHEQLEERYVFPKLEQASKLNDITAVLRTQHQRGRTLTDRVLAATTAAAAPDQPARDALAQDMAAFIRMYEPHEAREDTVVFPALRDVVPARQFRDLADIFEDEEHRRFGQTGFHGVVDKVADIEKSLGIYDLSQFTAS